MTFVKNETVAINDFINMFILGNKHLSQEDIQQLNGFVDDMKTDKDVRIHTHMHVQILDNDSAQNTMHLMGSVRVNKQWIPVKDITVINPITGLHQLSDIVNYNNDHDVYTFFSEKKTYAKNGLLDAIALKKYAHDLA